MRLLLALLLSLLPFAASAAPVPDASAFTFRQELGASVPKSADFVDETGRAIRIGALLGGRPVILALGYFHCPNLCGIIRADLYNALDKAGLVAGRDYTLVALSIDPAETSADAASAKRTDISQYPLPGAAANWHFLTGTAAAVRTVSDAVGFRDRFDPEIKQFLHPAGLVFLSPSGIVSSYLLGVGYAPGDVKLGVARANAGTVATAALPILLLCFHFDPTTGRYTLVVLKLLRIGAAITVLMVGGTLFLAFRGERRRPT